MTVRAGVGLLLIATISAGARGQRSNPPASCQPAAPLVAVSELPEGSGLALGRANPARLWALNDSSEPVVFALDLRGAVTGRVRLAGVVVEDWEAIAAGPCPAGWCLHVADIGDNAQRRKRITIYRFTESAGDGKSAAAEAFHATYPDGPHDAEAFFIAPDGRWHIVTKDPKSFAVYRFPPEPRAGQTAALEHIGGAGLPKSSGLSHITDATVSRDGRWTALRTGSHLAFYSTPDFIAGRWTKPITVDLGRLKETQGEGLALDADDKVFLLGEGGSRGRAGTFASFPCRLSAP